MQASKWGRWYWDDRKRHGRWHAIAGSADKPGAMRLACGRIRQKPDITAGRPGNEKCCPTCRQLDDLRLGYKAEKPEVAPEVAPTPLVTA